jgi:hypothetical protein
VEVAQAARVAGHTPEAIAKEAATHRKHAQARAACNPAKQPVWLTEQVFSEKIQPALATASATAIAKQIGVSRWYPGRIREGYRPHPRHWWKGRQSMNHGFLLQLTSPTKCSEFKFGPLYVARFTALAVG